MTLIQFTFACGLLFTFAARVHQRRLKIVALTVAESGVRNLLGTAEGISRCSN